VEESHRTYRRRTYETFQLLFRETPSGGPLRIEEKWTDVNWKQVWHNLHVTPVVDGVKDTWYAVLHDILLTKTRLHAIRLAPSAACDDCNMPDTIPHKLVECGEGSRLWHWIRHLLSIILRTDPRLIPDEWLYRPQFKLWPPQRHRAVLWILARTVAYRCQRGARLTHCDFHDFLRRARWKLYQVNQRLRLVGSYLSVLDL
jgi:hypothetical protein